MGLYDQDSVGALLTEVLRACDEQNAINVRSGDYLVALPLGLVDTIRARLTVTS